MARLLRAPPCRNWLWAAASLVAAILIGVTTAGAQPTAQAGSLGKGMEAESAGDYRQAVAAYRSALGTGDNAAALLGLERAYAALGWTDSLLPVLDSLIGQRPGDALLQAVRLRALTMVGREQRALAMFDEWVERSPGDPKPYREFARILLDAGRILDADSVLKRAQNALGSGRDVALELAQLRAQMGLWGLSALSWREALHDSPYLVQATAFALQPTPAAARDSVRAALAGFPPEAAARQALARLELSWGDAAAGWRSLAQLPPTDSTVNGWIAFADEAEGMGAFSVAADALAAAVAARPTSELRMRAAAAALRAGRASVALALTERAMADAATNDSVANLLLPLRVRSLSALGRARDAERLVNAAEAARPERGASLQRELAWAWVRAGDVARARVALERAGADTSDEVHGWLALYDGDLRGARSRLRVTDDAPDYIITALALLGRTTVDSAPAVGNAFLALARADTAAAIDLFARSADEVPDAAPLLLSTSARLAAASGDHESAIVAWTRITAEFATSPEAAEAYLGWARLLSTRGEHAEAARRLEHLILSYPESALVPQARRELATMSAESDSTTTTASPSVTPPGRTPPP